MRPRTGLHPSRRRFAAPQDEGHRHCEKRRDKAIRLAAWRDGLLRLARNDVLLLDRKNKIQRGPPCPPPRKRRDSLIPPPRCIRNRSGWRKAAAGLRGAKSSWWA